MKPFGAILGAVIGLTGTASVVAGELHGTVVWDGPPPAAETLRL